MRHGFILVDKPTDMTSHDAVAIVRRTLGERSVGHLGTLDPAATGLLVIAVGKKALKVIELFSDMTKEYEANVTLGAVSSTYDKEGVIEEVSMKPGVEIPTDIQIQNLIADRFIGKINQVPPSYSAVHINGERAYRLAQKGVEVEMPSRSVEIHKCEVLSYQYPYLQLLIECGSGTYIRSLAHDMGQLLHCGGYLSGLRRTKVGKWRVEAAVEPEAVNWTQVIPLKDILVDFPRIDLLPDEEEDIRHGRMIEREVEPNTFGWSNDLPIALLKPVAEGVTGVRKLL
jgi:tRNA pseudouridine55 synthase